MPFWLKKQKICNVLQIANYAANMPQFAATWQFCTWNLLYHSEEHIYCPLYKIQEDWSSNMDFIKYAAFQLFCSTIFVQMSTLSRHFYYIKIPPYPNFYALCKVCSPNSPRSQARCGCDMASFLSHHPYTSVKTSFVPCSKVVFYT